eukprot:CAMPEP_0117673090 /NCGR_PEP_ID=MMETSP0804-20121206/14281_1 /TAXON_ID=1074897 /ORGANISM="Tetraselmis astigmatica, Strain CCMP880" /LENGTH=115 /DNA_ID=CAMNT_0005481793 /DNA_START=347 /DNA_END=694 /DNA_ORIENTATION=+
MEELTVEMDEGAALLALENQIKRQYQEIQDHIKLVEPIGMGKANGTVSGDRDHGTEDGYDLEDGEEGDEDDEDEGDDEDDIDELVEGDHDNMEIVNDAGRTTFLGGGGGFAQFPV